MLPKAVTKAIRAATRDGAADLVMYGSFAPIPLVSELLERFVLFEIFFAPSAQIVSCAGFWVVALDHSYVYDNWNFVCDHWSAAIDTKLLSIDLGCGVSCKASPASTSLS